MFLFGIFTSHIPYIAFVVFYAYILLFGVEKATQGKLQSGQNIYIAELQVEYQTGAGELQEYSCNSGYYFQNSAQFEPFIFKRKLKPLISRSTFQQADFYSTISNRPPPAIG